MAKPRYVIVWRYDVPASAREQFIAAYGGEGAWARLFGKARGFVRTELYRDEEGGFLTLDFWTSEAAWESFQGAYGEAYRALDVTLARLSVRQTRIGGFTLA